jgi:hypothetical protein
MAPAAAGPRAAALLGCSFQLGETPSKPIAIVAGHCLWRREIPSLSLSRQTLQRRPIPYGARPLFPRIRPDGHPRFGAIPVCRRRAEWCASRKHRFPAAAQARANFLQRSSLHRPAARKPAEVGYIRDAVVARSVEALAAFSITHGDLMFDDLSFYDRYNRIVGSMGLPWYSCCGNRDVNLEAPDNTHSRETFKRVFGARHYAFQYGGATVFVLDNVEYLGADRPSLIVSANTAACSVHNRSILFSTSSSS